MKKFIFTNLTRTMKHLVYLSAITLLVAGCAPRYALKGKYRESPYAIPTKAPADSTWNQLMDFMALENITPRLVKKKKYMIISDTYSFKTSNTSEDAGGNLIDSTKYVVLPKFEKDMALINATAYWTIRIQERKNKTAVLIQLSKVTATYESKNGVTKLIGNNVSTDRFEKKLRDFLTGPPAQVNL